MTPREDQALPENNFGKAPRLVRGVDIRSLPIGPEEAFVLSCVDGMTSQEDIASATGFDSDAVARVIRRLTVLGAIEFEPMESVRVVPSERMPGNSSGAYRIRPTLEPSVAPSVHPTSIAPDSVEARRRALARKLGHSSAPPARFTTKSDAPESSLNFRAQEIKRQEQLATQARQQQLDRYLALANEAAAQHDLVSAVNSLRIACALAPEDASLARKLAGMQQRAAEENWEEYAERANYEVFEGRLAEAARSYEFAALGHPTWRFFERAAFCFLNSGGDLKRAGELAKRAVALSPDNPKCRLTLAQIYIAAKLKQSALAELERALALDPKQESIKETIRSVKRGEL